MIVHFSKNKQGAVTEQADYGSVLSHFLFAILCLFLQEKQVCVIVEKTFDVNYSLIKFRKSSCP